MGTDPGLRIRNRAGASTAFTAWPLLTWLAALTGLLLLYHAIVSSSATYDEVAYLRIAAHWWRSGDQSEITRMGSPLLFWKLQQAPVLWILDRIGRGRWIDDPLPNQQKILPLLRLGSLWIWLAALLLVAAWSRRCYGRRAMVLAAWLFALSPNLIAHGALVTMELPLVAATTGMFYLFWRFMESNCSLWFWACAALGGVAFSCKFTAILLPPILGAIWWVMLWRQGKGRLLASGAVVLSRMFGFVLVMMLANLLVTGFAGMPLSTSRGSHPSIPLWLGGAGSRAAGWLYETPLPQDWVGFASQLHHQASGGMSYLFGRRRPNGWWYYYFVALTVKVPLSFWLLATARLAMVRSEALDEGARAAVESRQSRLPTTVLLPLAIALYLMITAVGSSRNYGLRYLLPLAPLGIVWVSALAEYTRAVLSRLAIAATLAGYLVALAGIHPYELVYFNALAGGPLGGRHILADSNLDWGQGLKSLVRLQSARPEFRDMTLYYFGDTDPSYYGVTGRCHVINAVDEESRLPGLESVQSRYLGVSASLQWGPWGPAGFFGALDSLQPVCLTDDTTIAIYRTNDLRGAPEAKALERQAVSTPYIVRSARREGGAGSQ